MRMVRVGLLRRRSIVAGVIAAVSVGTAACGTTSSSTDTAPPASVDPADFGVAQKLSFPDLKKPGPIAVDSNGLVVVGDVRSGEIYVLRPGGVATAIPLKQISSPSSLAFDSGQNLIVSDDAEQLVQRVTASYLKDQTGDVDTLSFDDLRDAVAVAVDKAGKTYVLDRDPNLSESSDTPSTEPGALYVLSPGSKYPEVAFFDVQAATAIGVDGDDSLYVAMTDRPRIDKYPVKQERPVELPLPPEIKPTALAVDKQGQVYVCDGTSVAWLFPPGAVQAKRFELPQVSECSGIAVAVTGDLYVADSGTGEVLKLAVKRQ